MPIGKMDGSGESMYILSTFDQSNLQSAIKAVQKKGIANEDILDVSMEKKVKDRKLFDSIHSSDGFSLLDFPIVLATIFCLFGSIYGFLLTWGPLLWGLIGMVIGFTLGLIVKLIMTKIADNKQINSKAIEVVLLIECKETQGEMLKDLLWDHHALGVRKLDLI